jgi:hypothetical protein
VCIAYKIDLKFNGADRYNIILTTYMYMYIVEPRSISDQPVSEPEPVSQGEEDGEVEVGGELQRPSEPLETAADDGSTEQVGHSKLNRLNRHATYCS